MKKAIPGTGIMLTLDLTNKIRTEVARQVSRNSEQPNSKFFIEGSLWHVGFALDPVLSALNFAIEPSHIFFR